MRHVIVVVIVCIITLGTTLRFPVTSTAGSAKPTPGGTITVSDPLAPSAVLTDSKTGTAYTLGLIATEDPIITGIGNVALLLQGPSLSVCSSHGPSAVFGDKPLSEIECGTAFGQAVAVDGCAVTTQFHGYVHSDHPNVNYFGTMTLDLRVQKDPGASDGMIDLTVHTPKDDIMLRGSVTGPVVMDTCP